MCQLKNPPTKAYLTAYLFMFFLFGLLGGSLGPIIPYLSKQRNVDETAYSFLFIAQSVGSIVAFLSYKIIQWKKPVYAEHKIMVVWSLIVCGTMFMFAKWDSRFAQFASLAIFGGGQYGALTIANICIILITKQKASIWIILINALYGVGALISPQIIRFVELDCYLIYIGLFLVSCTIITVFPSPMKKLKQDSNLKQQTREQYEPINDLSEPLNTQSTQKVNQESQNQQSLAKNQQISDDKHQQNLKLKKASRKLELLIALGLFLIAGIEYTVPGWLPSYAVLVNIVDKSEATLYTTLFWSASTLVRFAAAALTLKSSVKLKVLLALVLICSGACSVLHKCDEYSAAALMGSIGYGVACSAVLPLIVSISIEFGIKFAPQQLSNMMVAPILSSMCISAVDGWLMGWNIDMLFYFLLFVSGLLILDAFAFFKVMQQEKMKNDEQFERSIMSQEGQEKRDQVQVNDE